MKGHADRQADSNNIGVKQKHSPRVNRTRRRQMGGTTPHFVPVSRQPNTLRDTGCEAVTRRTMNNRPVRRRRPGVVRHLLLAAAFIACSSQMLAVEANSWW